MVLERTSKQQGRLLSGGSGEKEVDLPAAVVDLLCTLTTSTGDLCCYCSYCTM